MNDTYVSEFTAKLTALFPRLDPEQVKVWIAWVRRYEAGSVMAGLNEYYATEKRGPNLSNFVATVRRVAQDASRVSSDSGIRFPRCPNSHQQDTDFWHAVRHGWMWDARRANRPDLTARYDAMTLPEVEAQWLQFDVEQGGGIHGPHVHVSLEGRELFERSRAMEEVAT